MGELAESVQSGFASGNHNRDGVGVPHLRPMNIDRGGRLALVDMRFVEDSDGHRLRRGDVLFNNTNSAELVGKTTWIDTDDELAFSNHMTRVRLPTDVAPAFVAHQLHHMWSRGVFKLLCNNHVSQASVSASALSDEVELALPPTGEQRRIVARIQELTARSQRAREALDAVPPLLDKLRQSILAAAFRGDLTADWRAAHPNVEPAGTVIERIRAERRRLWELNADASERRVGAYKEAQPLTSDAELVLLPDEWTWTTADECAWDITVGHVGPMSHRYANEGVAFLRSQNVRENRFSLDGLLRIGRDFHEELPKSALKPGDLVVVRSGAPGTACVIPPELSEANCADLVICRLVPSIAPQLLCYFVNSDAARSQVLAAQVGVAQQHFNVGSMRRMVVPIIPVDEQLVLLEKIERAFAFISSVEYETAEVRERADQLDTSVLAKAFRGELVPQDPNDEPASVLLERIRAAREGDAGQARQRRRAAKGEAAPKAKKAEPMKGRKKAR